MSDVELVDLKFLEDDPVVVVQFTCQQLNCSRDQCAPGASVSPAWLCSVVLLVCSAGGASGGASARQSNVHVQRVMQAMN